MRIKLEKLTADQVMRDLAQRYNVDLSDAARAMQILEELGERKRAYEEAQKAEIDLRLQPRCCGHEWRNKAGYMYVHHSSDDDCPIHGKSEPGKRGLRVYIGNKPAKITEAHRAMQTWGRWIQARKDFAEARRRWQRLEREFYQVGAEQQSLW